MKERERSGCECGREGPVGLAACTSAWRARVRKATSEATDTHGKPLPTLSLANEQFECPFSVVEKIIESGGLSICADI